MTSNKSNHEAELQAAKRAEVKRIRLKQKATNKELLDAYKALNVAYKSLKKNKQPS
tara:strand:- start:66 stop:233 length:168 start_codon:yes stop_codon:yes gene_type:complete